MSKLLEALSAQQDHVLVLQHLYSDSSLVMHVAASVEAPQPRPPRPPPPPQLPALAAGDDDGWWVPPSNITLQPVVPPPSLRPRSQRRDWAELVDDGEQPPPKRQRRVHKPRYYVRTACEYCGTEYRYPGSFEK